jgi:hypothetical protein
VLGDTLLDGTGDAVLGAVGSGLADAAELGETVAEGPVGDGQSAGTASAGTSRDLCSMASKTSRTTLTKTNPPMAAFGQWPFEKSGMRGSLTAKPSTSATTGQPRQPATAAGPATSDQPKEAL